MVQVKKLAVSLTRVSDLRNAYEILPNFRNCYGIPTMKYLRNPALRNGSYCGLLQMLLQCTYFFFTLNLMHALSTGLQFVKKHFITKLNETGENLDSILMISFIHFLVNPLPQLLLLMKKMTPKQSAIKLEEVKQQQIVDRMLDQPDNLGHRTANRISIN